MRNPSHAFVAMAGHARRRRAGGFTLVEALAAALILSLATAVIAGTLGRAYGALAGARDGRDAAVLLDQVLTKVDMIGPARLADEGPTEGGFAAPYERFAWDLAITSRFEGHLYEVTAGVSWDAASGRRRVEIVTLINDPPNSRSAALRWSDL